MGWQWDHTFRSETLHIVKNNPHSPPNAEILGLDFFLTDREDQREK
jgi:hypothetical protein